MAKWTIWMVAAWACLGVASAPGAQAPTLLTHDLTKPEYNPPDAPAWCRQKLLDWVKPHVGKNGLPAEWRNRPGPLGDAVEGVDRYQANHFVVYGPPTAKYVYGEYTPLKLNYRKGSLPTYEAAVAKYTAGCATDTDKAVALLTRAMADLTKHPTMPPCGAGVSPSRGLEDEPLLASGLAWCNEQARIYVRLCQVAGIPARIVHLFYSDKRTGHTIAEFHADGRWAMADATWLCVFPGPDGKLLSAEQCHDAADGQLRAGAAYHKRFQELAKLPDNVLYPRTPAEAAKFRNGTAAKTAKQLADQLFLFAVINNPLP